MSKCTTDSTSGKMDGSIVKDQISTIIQIDKEQQAILNKLADLPPNIWLLEYCHTDDQRAHWDDCKLYFEWLNLLLKDFFAGKHTQGLDLLPLEDKQFWSNYRDTYIKLYEIIQYSWTAIRKVLKKIQVDEINSPGEMLIEILEWEAVLLFGRCTNHLPPQLNRFSLDRFSPRKEYKEYQKRFERKPLEKEDLWLAPYHNFCLTIAEEEACKDSLLKKKLSDYKKLRAEVESDLHKEIHPRKKVHGNQWIDGQKEPLLKRLPKNDIG